MSETLLSVCLITYNHAKYIKDALDGVLMQKVSFPWEIIISDDCSTDGTQEILMEYKSKYPLLISLKLQNKNVGPAKTWIDLITAPTSKYIAYSDGDDFWTDPLKLQKQVDFMESNPDYSLCFHNVQIKHEGVKVKDYLFCDPSEKETHDIKDAISRHGIPTVSMLFRKELLVLPDWFIHVYNGDYALHLIMAYKGKIKYFNDVMAVYRRNQGGLNAKGKNSEIWLKLYDLLCYFDNYSDFQYHALIQQRKKELRNQIIQSISSERSRFIKIISPEFYLDKIKFYLKK